MTSRINLSDRVNSLEESGIRQVFALAARNQGEYIDLSIGLPDFDVSDELIKALGQSASEGANRYTPTHGLPLLRKRVAEKLRDKNSIPAKDENIIITAGASGGLFLALSTLLDPGDEVVIPDPYFVSYRQLALFLGAKPVYWSLYPDFRPKPGDLDKLITSRTKCLIINSPNNPTGVVYSREELALIAEVAAKHNLPVISDEVYEEFDYEGKFTSLASLYDRTITVNGFSKSLAITGWRAGYVCAPEECVEAMAKLQQYTFVCAPSVVQSALLASWGTGRQEEITGYLKRRDLVWDALKDKFNIIKPEGAFYAFVEAPAGRQDFWHKLANNKLLTVPGNVFSQKSGYLRLSFAASQEQVVRGMEIFKKIVCD
jgi:aspartate aminotransferase/aminotransferase